MREKGSTHTSGTLESMSTSLLVERIESSLSPSHPPPPPPPPLLLSEVLLRLPLTAVAGRLGLSTLCLNICLLFYSAILMKHLNYSQHIPYYAHQRPALPHDRRHPCGGLRSIFRFRVRRGAHRLFYTSTEAASESADKTEPEEVDVDSSSASEVQEEENSAAVDRGCSGNESRDRNCNCACANLQILPIMPALCW